MRDIDNDIRSSLERLTDPHGNTPCTDALWSDLVSRRRKRRNRTRTLAALPLLLVSVLAVGILSTRGSSDDRSDVATGAERAASPDAGTTSTLRVENIRVEGNGPYTGGTERAIIDFNEPLPVDTAQYVADIASADPAAGMVWTAQGPDSISVCESVHSVPGGEVGSVDLLVPASWFADADAHTVTELETTDNPGKFPICGPHNGFIQYAMWAPLSADPADVTVTVSPDRTSVTIQVGSDTSTTLDPHAGQGVVAQFLDHLRAGDLEAAAGLWTGYPELGPDSTATERVSYVEDLMADPTFTRILSSESGTTFRTPATSQATGAQVVTVLDARSSESPPVAVAFLTGLHDEEDGPGAMWIERLPSMAATSAADLPADAYVTPGEAIVLPGVPIEGGARAFINGTEVQVEVDQESLTMSVVVPRNMTGDIAVTFAIATPELPDVQAFAMTVRP